MTDKLYRFIHGHPFLLKEEADIIVEARFDEKYLWMNDEQIQHLVRIRVKRMYRSKYPDSKRFNLKELFK